MNQVSLVGRLTRDVDVIQTSNGYKVVNNTLAIHRPGKSVNGKDVTDFVPIVCWGPVAEIFANHLHKGDLVGVSGRMQSHSYENKYRQRVFVVECHVEEITMLPNGKAASHRNKPMEALNQEEALTDEAKQALTDDIIEEIQELMA